MTKNTLIKLGSLGFSGIVAFGTYKFIQKNEKVLYFLTGNSKLKNIRSDVYHEDINNSINYELRDASNAADNVQKQKLLKVEESSDDVAINTKQTPISTTNNTSDGINLITEKFEPKTTFISNNVTFNKPQVSRGRLRWKERSRQHGFLSSLN